MSPPPAAEPQLVADREMMGQLETVMARAGLPVEAQREIVDVIEAAASDTASFVRKYAVPCERFYGKNKCVICEETVSFTFHYAKEQMMLRPGGLNGGAVVLAGNALQRKKQRLDLSMRARVAVSAQDQNAHKLISFLQTLLAGTIDDDRIFRMMLILRRYLVEQFFEEAERQYVKWRLQDLREHFHPTRGHQYDPLRQEIYEHNRLRKLYDSLSDIGADADFNNKDVLKRVGEVGKIRKQLIESRRAIDEQMAQKDPNLPEALRTVAMAITKNITDINADLVATDVETGAGMLEMGGDMMRSAANRSLEYKDPGTMYSHQLSCL